MAKILKRDLLRDYGQQIKDLGINLNICTKQDLLKIVNFRCEHKHSAFTHPSCYKNAPDNQIEKVGVLDIETSNLHGDFGIILSWCIKVSGSKVVYKDYITPSDIHKGLKDKRITVSVIEHLKLFDRLVTQFGTYFDLPFIRTRAEKHDLDFPCEGSIYHTDVWKIAKRKLRLHSNRQGSIAETVLNQDIKTRIHPDKWLEIQFGTPQERKSAIDYIVDHNEKDVKQCDEIYLRIRKYVKEGRTSI